MIPINTITICVNYGKKLDYIAARSHQWFSKWYIVTEETDIETIEARRNGRMVLQRLLD